MYVGGNPSPSQNPVPSSASLRASASAARRRPAPGPRPASCPPTAPPLAPGLPGGAGRVGAAAPPTRSPSGRAGRTGTPLCRLALLFTLRKTFSFLPFRQALSGPEGGEGPKKGQGEGTGGGRGAGLPRDALHPPGRRVRIRRRGSACLAALAGRGDAAGRATGPWLAAPGRKGAGNSPAREPPFCAGLRDGSPQPPPAGVVWKPAALRGKGSPRP